MRIYYAQYNQMTDFETEYVFCKDNRLVVIVEGLFAKASTANASLSSWSSALFSGSTSSFALKQHTQIQSVLAHSLKVANLTSYKKLSGGYFELKLHIRTLGISETYFTACKKEHNSSLLKALYVGLTPSGWTRYCSPNSKYWRGFFSPGPSSSDLTNRLPD